MVPGRNATRSGKPRSSVRSIKRDPAATGSQGGESMKGYYFVTRYGWLVVLDDGRRVEVATEEEARELLSTE